jgi:hypothetical protein
VAAFASLSAVKAHLNMTSTANDDELGLMLEAANDVVRSLVGSFGVDDVTETVAVHGGTAILSHRPVVGDVQLDGAVTGYLVNRAAGLLHDLPPSLRSMTVAYTAGREGVPAAVTLATAIITGHLWETQRGTSPSALALQRPDMDVPFAGGIGYAIPNRAKELLEPFIRHGAQIA